MSGPLDAVGLDLDGAAAVGVPAPVPVGLGCVGGGGCLAQPEHVGPLLDRLLQQRVRHERVVGAVPQLHARAGPGVAGVRLADRVAPLLRGPVHVSAGALAAGGREVRRVGEAVERHAHERGAGLEQVGVEGEHVVGHHAAGRTAGGVDPLRIGRVLLLHVPDHRDDRHRVAAAATSLRGVGPDVEAVAEPGLLGGGRVDHDVPVSVGEAGELAPGVEAGAGPAAAVHRHHDRRASRAVVRHVDVHAHPARVVTEAGHLGQ
ncbi:hypothetical protein GAR05_02126 [Micromonospora saelicesensis]|uniref:Uncharacterized protein n=1 Tax=Micromonospora saelicesensis TaxID=285676 RepID=A0ABX9CKW8_9ACTN|nr:hypothetical protein GAR05_02126 [Micromonospora saelicesensis]